MKIIYNKLVRDKIPEIIEKSGKKCSCSNISDEEKEFYLKEKLKEEMKEILEAKDEKEKLEELIDLETVIRALVKYYDVYSYYGFYMKVRDKILNRGNFDKFIKLDYVEDDENKSHEKN